MHLDLSRVGIAFWGVSPWGRKATLPLDLKPVMRIKARVKQVKTLPPGSSVGYGGTFTTSRETKIAIISIGYSQGLFRSLSNRMEVLVRGKRAPSRGNISMDQMTVEVTGIEGVEKGDIATVVGKEGKEEVTIEEIADLAHTVPHEVLCSLGKIKNRMIYENHCSLAK
jgi:alanine racemase